MSKNTNAAPRGTQSSRPNASRALLLRKAVEKLGHSAPFGEAIEDSFPAAPFIGPMLPAVEGAPDVSNTTDAAPAVEYIESVRQERRYRISRPPPVTRRATYNPPRQRNWPLLRHGPARTRPFSSQ